MRIAIVAEVFLPKIDGVVGRLLNLIRHLVDAGDEVLIVCPEAEGCTNCQVPVLPVPSFTFPPYPEYRVGIPDRNLAAKLREFNPDVIHYLNPFAFGFRCYDVLRGVGFPAPTVFSFHTAYGEFAKRYKGLNALSSFVWWLTREYHNRADLNLTVSAAMQQDLIRRGFERVELWPPAVDSDLYHPNKRSEAMRARLSGGRPERKLLLTVSRLAPEKNVSFLAGVLRQVPDACLAIVGDGPARASLEQEFNGLDARFIGYLKGEELAAAYASVDAFVYASETETMGNVVLEAMACGQPVVAPNALGIPSLFTDKVSGFLYPPRDLPAAVQLTRDLLTDDALRARIAAAARLSIEERNWTYAVKRVREVYAEAIRTGRQPGPWTWRDRITQAATFAIVSAFRAVPGKREGSRWQPDLKAKDAAATVA
jgi:glycosyltransferase involved in cell wall biosynthesis